VSVWQVTRGLEDFPLLFSLMRLVQSLLLNPHIHIEPYVSLLELLFFCRHLYVLEGISGVGCCAPGVSLPELIQ
jgi:hypothetical protein